MHYDGIWKCFVLHRKMKTMSLKNAFWPYLKRLGTSEKTLRAMFLKYELWRYLKRFGTAENFLKAMFLKFALWRDLKRFGYAEKNENTDGKWCILTGFEMIWNFYVKTCECSILTPFSFYCIFWYFFFFDFLEKVVGPGLQGLDIATPVTMDLQIYINNFETSPIQLKRWKKKLQTLTWRQATTYRYRQLKCIDVKIIFEYSSTTQWMLLIQ